MVISVCLKSKLGANSGVLQFTRALTAGVRSERRFSNLTFFLYWLPGFRDGSVRAEAPPSHYPSIVICPGLTKGQRTAKCWLIKSGAGVRTTSLATSWIAPQPPPSSNTPSPPSVCQLGITGCCLAPVSSSRSISDDQRDSNQADLC